GRRFGGERDEEEGGEQEDGSELRGESEPDGRADEHRLPRAGRTSERQGRRQRQQRDRGVGDVHRGQAAVRGEVGVEGGPGGGEEGGRLAGRAPGEGERRGQQDGPPRAARQP